VVVQASPTPHRLVLSETNDHRFFLTVFSAEDDGSEQNSSAASPPAETDNAAITQERGMPVDAEFARAMQMLWVLTLNRTQYPRPSDIATARVDGVSYHFWGKSKNTGALAGYAHSPRSGSYLDELCQLVHALTEFARRKGSDPEKLKAWMKALAGRARQNEPCDSPSQ
jgi:hypothetical protein